MPLNIKIENFEGPFDLLLHLIKKNKMDIYDVKIHEITYQYLEYIHRIREMDLEVTSEFIVMAASLLEIKSKTLLPKQPAQEENEDEDPRKQLIEKLIEYNKFKSAAEFLKNREIKTGKCFSKKPEIIVKKTESLKPQDFLKGMTMLKLYNIYSKLINTYIDKINVDNKIEREIPKDKFKIEDKMNYIKSNVDFGQTIQFSNILNKCSFKIEKVVTFIALLELIRLGIVSAIQNENFNEIYIERLILNESN